ncbi:ATP-binding cassette subfamily C protein CydD [Murinocardiopsis flavida]|uniref:ATP-binding cassette subfamily C protein CydD n=1 Tax=Murinocardiopsis flavida TaxID=645275 RepID=A0A2P8DEJ7_9ACTN|nr:thiol reductant ABC exporter subunit CydD [Murinocardiopsis flavida]PSK95597.1 ATP-binding cassette subfamily C protein CydD [Murinocardiopsis flavida]
MRPLDPRLVRTARAVRVHLAVTVVCGAAVTALILLQAWLLAHTIAGAAEGAGPRQLSWAVAALAGVALARAVLSYGAETAALRSAARAKSQLRTRLVAHVTGADRAGGEPQTAWLAGASGTGTPRAGELVTLATRGLDALDDYFARYLPQLVLAMLVPVAVLVVVFGADWISGVIVAVTIPLIPLFMALVGMHTRQRTERQWALLNRLGGHFLDVVEGLPTLAVFRRAKAQAAIIRRITEEHRTTTMATLRVAFLSAFVLELLATLAVALVAVQIGIRLMYGLLDFETALLVLILAPEAYLPLREVGARFHASMEGVAAAQQVFATLDEKAAVKDDGAAARPAPPPALLRGPGAAAPRIRLDGVTLVYPGRETPALRDASLVFAPGRRTLLTGPSGSGKSTLLALLLRMREPTGGAVRITPADGPEIPLADVPADQWRALIAWVPQQPYLFDDTVAGNIRLGAPDADDAAVRRAAERAEAHAFVARLPDGYETRLGERGARLSAGQRQRIALARAFLRDAPIVLLDEPTAHLDPDNAAAVRRAAGRLLDGRTGIIVAHDLGWADVADDVVPIHAGAIALTDAAEGA